MDKEKDDLKSVIAGKKTRFFYRLSFLTSNKVIALNCWLQLRKRWGVL